MEARTKRMNTVFQNSGRGLPLDGRRAACSTQTAEGNGEGVGSTAGFSLLGVRATGPQLSPGATGHKSPPPRRSLCLLYLCLSKIKGNMHLGPRPVQPLPLSSHHLLLAIVVISVYSSPPFRNTVTAQVLPSWNALMYNLTPLSH